MRKQYDCEQIAYLIAITLIKGVVPMEHCARLFAMQKGEYPAQVAYDYFCDELENVLQVTFGFKEEIEEIGTSNTELKRMLRSVIVAVANVIYVQHRFDEIAREEAANTETK